MKSPSPPPVLAATSAPTATPDLVAVKHRQQQMWASGDYHAIAAHILPTSERLVDSADLAAGATVLDVACGSGNASLAAARIGCRVLGVDYVPTLLARASRRAEAEGFDIDFRVGDAEALPLGDGSVDAALSVFGVMFAPDQGRAAAELLRVVRPDGTIALANWTPAGFIGDLFRMVGRYVSPAAGVRPPVLWGTEPHLRTLFGDGVRDLRVEARTFTFRYPSAEALVSSFRTWYGPTLKAFAALDAEAQDALHAEFLDLVRRYDRRGGGDGPVAVPGEYVEVVATRA